MYDIYYVNYIMLLDVSGENAKGGNDHCIVWKKTSQDYFVLHSGNY